MREACQLVVFADERSGIKNERYLGLGKSENRVEVQRESKTLQGLSDVLRHLKQQS
jgi:hypothetical protein